jgi:Domain of unknown function (DUF4126)
MDLTTAIGSVFAAFGLSGAAGLNAFLPLFVSALLARIGVIDLAEPFDALSSTLGLSVLAVLLVADFVGDKVPVVDHALHIAGTVVAPASGAILFTGQTGLETDIPTGVAVVLGALTAGSVHAGRAAVRPVSTASTAGAGNPVLSLTEDGLSGGLTALAFIIPVLAFLLVIAFFAALVLGWRRLRGRRAQRAGRPPPSPR